MFTATGTDTPASSPQRAVPAPAASPSPLPSAANLTRHRLQQRRGGQGFVFASTRDPTKPFDPSSLQLPTQTAWKEATLTPIGLHASRHSYAAYMIAAGL